MEVILQLDGSTVISHCSLPGSSEMLIDLDDSSYICSNFQIVDSSLDFWFLNDLEWVCVEFVLQLSTVFEIERMSNVVRWDWDRGGFMFQIKNLFSFGKFLSSY